MPPTPPPPAAVVQCVGQRCLPAPASRLLTFDELSKRPRAKPAATLRYGPAPAQLVDLWLPGGPGPHPVAVMLHGGCWTKAIADRGYMSYAADDLRRHGVAVWNIEYRGVDEPGGGYPGTYQDVIAALDLLRKEAPRRGLKLDRVVAVGHSAGGHLALWAAARRGLPRSSPLHTADPLRIDSVIALGAIVDLERDLHTACGAEPVQAMAGPARPGGRYADTSPAHMPVPASQIGLVYGAQDHTVSISIGRAYAAYARAAGRELVVADPPGGHFDEVDPRSPIWRLALGFAITAANGVQ